MKRVKWDIPENARILRHWRVRREGMMARITSCITGKIQTYLARLAEQRERESSELWKKEQKRRRSSLGGSNEVE